MLACDGRAHCNMSTVSTICKSILQLQTGMGEIDGKSSTYGVKISMHSLYFINTLLATSLLLLPTLLTDQHGTLLVSGLRN